MPKLHEINDKSPEFMQAVNDFVIKPYGFFLIAGSNGSGKSFTARAIYDHFWHPHRSQAMWNQVELNMEWQKVYKEYQDTSYLLQRLVEAPLLVLDDLGVRTPTDAFMDFLYLLSEKRFESKVPCGTIITTNLNSQMLRERFGDPFHSRVSSGTCLRWDGPDRRCSKF